MNSRPPIARHRRGGFATATRTSHATEVRAALARGEIVPYYMPIVDLASGRWVGIEALSRWHRRGHLLAPAEYLPQLSGADLVAHDRHLAETALEHWAPSLRRATELGIALVLNLNLTAAAFATGSTIAWALRLRRRAGVPAQRIVLEITEQLPLGGDGLTDATIAALRHEGFAIALDDVGHANGSLTRLRTNMIDEVKIEREFVADLDDDGASFSSQAIAFFSAMTDRLGIDLVVEGVETEREESLLRGLGCRTVQGFRYGRPQPFAAFVESAISAGIAVPA